MNIVRFELKNGTVKEFPGEGFTYNMTRIFNTKACRYCFECPFRNEVTGEIDCVRYRGFYTNDILKCYRVTGDGKCTLECAHWSENPHDVEECRRCKRYTRSIDNFKKKEPVYEYQWIYKTRKEGRFFLSWELYKSEEEFLLQSNTLNPIGLEKIESTKRERK